MQLISKVMIIILRLNHRIFRDKRITTHVALTARAFLADKIYYSGEKDSNLEQSITKVSNHVNCTFGIKTHFVIQKNKIQRFFINFFF